MIWPVELLIERAIRRVGPRKMDAKLPADVAAYKRTPEFDQETIPAALRREHRTKPGVWALIQVIEGRLLYRILQPPGEQIVSPGVPGVVQPQQPHEVEPLGNVRFFVEFYARDEAPEMPHMDSSDLPKER
jgi:tellurite resistance-related uncharacterized protein